MNLVSVVVATYRREADLKRALESLANQTYPNLEIVLVDDNGNEEWNNKVSDIVSAFRKEFAQVSLRHIVNHPNMGSAKTRNIGIENSSGQYVTFLDDDDVYLPEKVQKQVKFMERDGCDYSITDLLLYDEKDREIDKRIRSYVKGTSVSDLRTYHLKYHMTGTDTMMFKREYLLKIGGFAPIDVGDEFYLMQRAIEGGGKFGYLPECDVKAYVHSGENGGVSSGDGKIKGENALYEYKKTFFSKLIAEDVRYIKMRHYAVIAYAKLRQKKYVAFAIKSLMSFCVSPVAFLSMINRRNGV